MDLESLLSSIRTHTELSDAGIDKIAQFHRVLSAENKIQNLTRLISPEDFVFGHLEDCIALSSVLPQRERCVDLGSGCGVPGLLTAIIKPDNEWILVESEKRKAEFLSRAAADLKMSNVSVLSQRFEDISYPKEGFIIVSRAVGSITKHIALISRCSTWNELILIKGPKWADELSDAKRVHKNLTATVTTQFKTNDLLRLKTSYEKSRETTIIKILNVPRGTIR